MSPLVSIIIPVYNEEKVIKDCLESLSYQTYRLTEIIVIDDGSTDKTQDVIKKCQLSFSSENETNVNCQMFLQNHLGPGPARNLGAKNSKGKILVFVDADMTFDVNFIKDLARPIIEGKTIGTFSKNEMNANPDNIWSKCWNINHNWPIERLIPHNYPNTAPVFRAIVRKKFEEVGGFERSGEYTDDWSLSKKLGIKSTLAEGAIYYHSNPDSLQEVWQQARWIGRNEFISGAFTRKIRSLIKYSFPLSLIIGVYKSIVKGQILFVIFKICYDFGIWISTVKSFFGESKSK